MIKSKIITQSGFSLIQTMLALSLMSGAGVLFMNYTQKQEKSIKKQSGDVSINYMLHNISKAISARSVCQHSYKSGPDDPTKPMKNGFQLNKIAIPSFDGIQSELILAKVGSEQDASKNGKFGFWISSMTIDDLEPSVDKPSANGIRKAKLWIEFNRRITPDEVKKEKTNLDLLLVESSNLIFDSCYGDEDFNGKAFCETSLRGSYDASTKLCKGITISPKNPGTSPEVAFAMNTVREPDYQNDNFRSDIFIQGGAKISEWQNGTQTKIITIDNGDIEDVRVLMVEQGIFANSVSATRYNHSSDRRLKTNIKPIEKSVSDDVLKLNGVSFKWKHNKQNALGFIAQEVEAVYPELVTTNPKTGMKAVDYAGLVPIVLERMKEQQEEIDDLKAQINFLKNKKTDSAR